MKRRRLLASSLAGLSGLAAWPALARQATIAFVCGGSGADTSTRRNAVEPFLEALKERGWVEGPELTIVFRWAEGQPDRIPGMVAELLRLASTCVSRARTPAWT